MTDYTEKVDVYSSAIVLWELATGMEPYQEETDRFILAQKIDKGLYIGNFESPKKSLLGDSLFTILKIDHEYYSFRLLSAKEQGLNKMTVKQWCEKFALTAGVNAGMFQTDFLSNVGYMKNFKHVNNSRINSKYLSVFAFNPKDSKDFPARIFDIDEKKNGCHHQKV